MTQLNTNSIMSVLQEELNKDGDFLKEMVKIIMQQLMEEERYRQVGVLSHQRDNTNRKANRNGYKPRSLNTRVGNLLLAKPQIRKFAFQTQLFENYQRSEKALLASICQMVTQGVSTNRVKKIVGKLSPDLIYSKSSVSRITQELDPQIKKWQPAQLQDYYKYLFTDALYFFVRVNHQVISCSVLITIGVDKNGYRKILGVDIAFEESYQSYLSHFNRLKEKGVKMAATVAKMIAQNYQQSYAKVSQMLEEELEFTLTYLSYPKHHRHKIRTTNLIEGVINKDLKQRSRVVGVFTNQESCMRYVCMRLMEIDEEWQTGRRHMKINKEDQFLQVDDPLLEEIKQIKEGVNTQEELVAT